MYFGALTVAWNSRRQMCDACCFWNATLCNLLLCELYNLEPRALFHEDGGIGCVRNVAKLRDATSKNCSVQTTTSRRAHSCVLQKETDALIPAPRLGFVEGVRRNKEIINMVVDLQWKSAT